MTISCKCIQVALLLSCSFGWNFAARGGEDHEGRIAIIHTNNSTILETILKDDKNLPGQKGVIRVESRDKLLKALHAAGVRVIGRYLARCQEKTYYWAAKSIAHRPVLSYEKPEWAIDNAEVQGILNAGFGIVTIYQYKSKKEEKFTHGKVEEKDIASCDPAISTFKGDAASATREGKMDARSAVSQARAIGQPGNTPIYFAVDENFDPPSNEPFAKGIIKYFKAVFDVLQSDDKKYQLGVYGNGAVLQYLIEKGQGSGIKIMYTWLSVSKGFHGSSSVYNENFGKNTSMKLVIVHAQSDNQAIFTKEGKCFTFEYDTDLQNPAYEQIGAWGKSIDGIGYEPFELKRGLAEEILSQHKIVCALRNFSSVPFRASCPGPTSKAKNVECCELIKGVNACNRRKNPSCYGQIVRITKGKPLNVDFTDTGMNDTLIPDANLTSALHCRPDWNSKKAKKDRENNKGKAGCAQFVAPNCQK